jgi:cell division transport system ATP-binding protein
MSKNENKNIILEFRKASVFQNKTRLLQAVDFKMALGEIVYIIGPNGSGKSSLLKCIYGELPLREGFGKFMEFDFNNLPISKLPFLKRRLGVVSEEFPLIAHLSLDENLMLVLKATNWTDKASCEKRIVELLIKFNLEGKRNYKVSSLDRAEKQRALIVRALLNSPSLLILDEPVSMLDESSAMQTMALVKELASSSKISVLIASNNEQLPLICPGKIYKLIEGSLQPEA